MAELAPSFDTIQQSRVPGVYTEFSADLASKPGPKVRRILLFGHRLEAATITDDVARRMLDEDQGKRDFGRNSPAGRMVEAAFRNNRKAEIWVIPEEESAGSVATSDSTVVGAATASGTFEWHIGSHKFTISIVSGDDETAVAVKMVAAVTAETDAPVSAANVAGVVTFTTLWKGLSANELRNTPLYEGGDPIAGIAIMPVAFTGGTDSDHDMTVLIGLIPDLQFDTVASEFNLAADQLLLEAELLTRWGGQVQLEGHTWHGINGTVAAMVALGDARNSKHNTNQGCGLSQSPTWEYAAGFAAANDNYAGLDPARPQQNRQVFDLKPPKVTDMYHTLSDQDALLADGVSTYYIESGSIFIQRTITTEQTRNTAPSVAHLDVTTMRQLMHYRYTWNAWLAGKYPNAKYGDDDDNVSPGQPVVSNSDIRSEAIQWWESMIFAGQGRDIEAFKAGVQVGNDPTDVNRANLILTPDLMRQLRIIATQMQFRL